MTVSLLAVSSRMGLNSTPAPEYAVIGAEERQETVVPSS